MRKRTGNVRNRGTSFQIRYVDGDGLRQSESYKTREEAERELAIRLGELAQGLPVSSRPNTVLFGELADDVTTDYEVNGYRSVDDLEARFRLHIIPVFGRRKASQITTAQIRSYTLKRQREGAKAGTINRELEAIRHTFNFALKGRKILHAPHVPLLREDNVRTGFFTREEVERLASHLKAPLDSLVMFAFLTGWRYGDIVGLLWANVDFERGEIRLDAGKTKSRKGRVFPMSTELLALLEQLALTVIVTENDHAPERRVLIARMATFGAQRVFLVGSFRKSWKTACYKAGIPCTVEPVRKGGRRGAVKVIRCSRTFHDLRRSFAREMDKQGVRQGAIMKLAGWETDSVFRRYNIISESDLKDAIETVNRAAKRAKTGK